MTPHIHLVITYPDGSSSTSTISGEPVTADMLAVAEELLTTLSTGERPPLKGLYELCARAFGATRADAKERLIAAMYGMDKKTFDQRMRLA